MTNYLEFEKGKPETAIDSIFYKFASGLHAKRHGGISGYRQKNELLSGASTGFYADPNDFGDGNILYGTSSLHASTGLYG